MIAFIQRLPDHPRHSGVGRNLGKPLDPGLRRGDVAGYARVFLMFFAGLLFVSLAGCASDVALKQGEKMIAEGKPREGLAQLQQAMQAAPGDLHLRTAYLRQRDLHIGRLLAQADSAAQAGQFDAAQASYREVLGLHPENPRAAEGLANVELSRHNQDLLRDAQAALNRDDYEMARGKLRAVLVREPAHQLARMLLAKVEEKAGRNTSSEAPQLAAAFRKPVTLEFRDAPLRQVFDALARQSGLNFIFDKDVRTDQKTTLFARQTAIADALDMLLATNQLSRKTLNGNTLLLYPNTPIKQRDYQDMVVRAFFLANADPKQIMTLIKTMTKTKDVHVDEKLNLVVIRDTPEVVRLVEKLVKVADRPEPEVMLEVEILEVKRSKLLELGVQWPTQFSVLNVTPAASSVTTPTSTTVTTPSLTPLTIRSLKGLNDSQISISPVPTVNLRAEDGDVNLLANPRIRVKNKEKAKVHVGDKVPVITSNVTSTGVTSESVSYLDVGLKLDVEPQVYLEGEVGIKVGLEVSNIVQQVKTATGTLTYQLGSRNATTTLRLRDGETQVLAGLISDEDRSSASKVPGLGDIPLLGRLFSNTRDDKTKSEIVLLITPRILRNVERPELADIEFFAGTDASASSQPIRLRPALAIPSLMVEMPVQEAPEPQDAPPPVVEAKP
jgi:general secretion pathway protein D